MTDDEVAVEPTFRPVQDGGLEVLDPIDGHRYTLETPAPVTPTETSTDRLLYPADAAVSVTTAAVELPTVVATYVRGADGEMLAEVEHFDEVTLPEGRYSVELCAPIKLYLRVEGALSVQAGLAGMTLEFGDRTTVVVGARSNHERPAATVTTTPDPEGVMAAVSTFGSALKTTSPERSFPTLRGHPPELELGDAIEVPDALSVPDTGVRLELPAEYRYAYVAAPLAYYLGAEVTPAADPRLVTDRGFEYPLPTGRQFEESVERLLKQTFLLDCVTRTEGYYPVDLHERSAVETAVDLDFEAVYDRPLAEQVAAYLEVPFDAVADYVPEWKLTTHVAPNPTSAETLPFVVDDLAVVRTPEDGGSAGRAAAQVEPIAEFLRDGEFTRSTASSDSGVLVPEDTASLEELWVGDETPAGASEATSRAFRNRLDRSPTTGEISITVVCNDAAMDEERDVVDDVYGSREDLPFDVTVHRDLGTEELADVLAGQVDFLHYIGHNDDDGFECADGTLDAADLGEVGVEAFFLNACRSYDQGKELIEAGSVCGVVTLSDVINDAAVRIGSTMARLLDQGFPLRAALSIARGESVMGGQYVVVGDGSLAVTQAESGTATLIDVERDGDGFAVEIETYVTSEGGMGSMFIPFFRENETYFLNSGTLDTFHVTEAEFAQFLELETVPLRVDGELRWSDEVRIEDL